MQERKRIEAVKRRQEKELQRMIEGEKKMSEIQRKIQMVSESNRLKVATVVRCASWASLTSG